MPFLTDTPDGAVLSLRIVPRAHKNAIQGAHGDALKIRLCAPPVDGAANAALIEFLSDSLSLPRARIQLLSGKTSRRPAGRSLRFRHPNKNPSRNTGKGQEYMKNPFLAVLLSSCVSCLPADHVFGCSSDFLLA